MAVQVNMAKSSLRMKYMDTYSRQVWVLLDPPLKEYDNFPLEMWRTSFFKLVYSREKNLYFPIQIWDVSYLRRKLVIRKNCFVTISCFFQVSECVGFYFCERLFIRLWLCPVWQDEGAALAFYTGREARPAAPPQSTRVAPWFTERLVEASLWILPNPDSVCMSQIERFVLKTQHAPLLPFYSWVCPCSTPKTSKHTETSNSIEIRFDSQNMAWLKRMATVPNTHGNTGNGFVSQWPPLVTIPWYMPVQIRFLYLVFKYDPMMNSLSYCKME